MYHLVYFSALIIFTCGLFIMLTADSYMRKIIGLCIFQSAILIFYLALGKAQNGIVPIIREEMKFHAINERIVDEVLSRKELGRVSSGAHLDVREQRNPEGRQRQFMRENEYSSPLPHVLMLTAIVVGFATLSVGLAFIYRIHEEFDTIKESEVTPDD